MKSWHFDAILILIVGTIVFGMKSLPENYPFIIKIELVGIAAVCIALFFVVHAGEPPKLA